jgi:hypothetical protein
MEEKPLFIPLFTQYYYQFKSGKKKIEYRNYGVRWNERTCRVGRRVIISCGYGKQKRLHGIVSAFNKITRHGISSAAIKIDLDED